MKEEKGYSPVSGYLALVIIILLVGIPVLAIIYLKMIWTVILIALGVFGMAGLMTVNPNLIAIIAGGWRSTSLFLVYNAPFFRLIESLQLKNFSYKETVGYIKS